MNKKKAKKRKRTDLEIVKVELVTEEGLTLTYSCPSVGVGTHRFLSAALT